jgi:hypothetical protein
MPGRPALRLVHPCRRLASFGNATLVEHYHGEGVGPQVKAYIGPQFITPTFAVPDGPTKKR